MWKGWNLILSTPQPPCPPQTTHQPPPPQPLAQRPLRWPKLAPVLCSDGELNEIEMRLKHNQDFSLFKLTFILGVSISDPWLLLWWHLNPVSRRHAWLTIIMHILYSPCVSSLLLPAHPALLTLHSHDLRPLIPLLFSPSRSWSCQSIGPTLLKLACGATLQTC